MIAREPRRRPLPPLLPSTHVHPTLSRLLLLPVAAALLAAKAPFMNASQPAPAGDAPLRLMSFNIRLELESDGANAWRHRRNLLCDVIRDFEPDVLGLQEALPGQLDFILAALPGRAFVGEARDGGSSGEYSALVYRAARLRPLASGTFWLSDTPGVPSATWGNRYRRICTWARFADAGTGTPFHVFNTHLDHESENARLRGVRLILERIRARGHGDPFVLMGDFNADEASAPIRLLTDPTDRNGLGLVDAFRVRHPDATDVGTFHAFTGRDDGRKIDAVFVEPTATVLEAAIVRTSRDGRYPSDHHPVTAVVRLGP